MASPHPISIAAAATRRDRPAIDPALLHALLGQTEPITVPALAGRIGCSGASVVRELQRLRMAGCRLEAHPQHGLRLIESGLTAWKDYLNWSPWGPTPRLVEVYGQTTSTQDAARRLLRAWGRRADGAVVAADEQTAGRGRLGRRWAAPAGTAVTFTRVCFDETSCVDRLTFATAVAVARAIEEVTGGAAAVQIKWPNDLLIAGGKVAGILVEVIRTNEPQHSAAALIGVGINVHLRPDQVPDDLAHRRDRITSIAMSIGRRVDRLAVLAAAVRAIDDAVRVTDTQPLLDEWRRRCPMMQWPVRVRSGAEVLSGQMVDVDPWAGLILRTDAGTLVHLPAATTTVL